MTTTATDLEAAVERGAALLDERGPADWRGLINLNELDMRHIRRCVVGQVFTGEFGSYGAWDAGIVRLGAPSVSEDAERDWAVEADAYRDWVIEFGFDITRSQASRVDHEQLVAYRRLTTAWVNYLTATG